MTDTNKSKTTSLNFDMDAIRAEIAQRSNQMVPVGNLDFKSIRNARTMRYINRIENMISKGSWRYWVFVTLTYKRDYSKKDKRTALKEYKRQLKNQYGNYSYVCVHELSDAGRDHVHLLVGFDNNLDEMVEDPYIFTTRGNDWTQCKRRCRWLQGKGSLRELDKLWTLGWSSHAIMWHDDHPSSFKRDYFAFRGCDRLANSTSKYICKSLFHENRHMRSPTGAISFSKDACEAPQIFDSAGTNVEDNDIIKNANDSMMEDSMNMENMQKSCNDSVDNHNDCDCDCDNDNGTLVDEESGLTYVIEFGDSRTDPDLVDVECKNKLKSLRPSTDPPPS